MTHLRAWQEKAIQQALKSYQHGQSSYLVVATPGAGKTTMASVLVSQLFELNLIDLVVCFTPSRTVKNSFTEDLSHHTGYFMHGGLGSRGQVLTYQALGHLDESFWQLFKQQRVFVIFDEIHHCSGSDELLGNAWGAALLNQISGHAAFTLLLSGTPWRTDCQPVTFAHYTTERQVQPSFIYGLEAAIDDKVCRSPRIVIIDNNRIEVRRSENEDPTHYDGIPELLNDDCLPYQLLLDNVTLQSHILERAIKQLNILRQQTPDAAGLIVASSVAHAEVIYRLLTHTLKQSALLITHKTSDAIVHLEAFNHSKDRWLVSVGMVSEGTNIPRLQVCCHLSRIRTELHFRQVLGRILRIRGLNDSVGYMFILADTALVKYAHRIEEDLPEESTVVSYEAGLPALHNEPSTQELLPINDEHLLPTSSISHLIIPPSIEIPFATHSEQGLNLLETKNQDIQVSLFGQFMEELITLQQTINSHT